MPTPEESTSFARHLRRRMTPAETALWSALRNANLGHRFRRQHPIPPYTIDFTCIPARLAIELDGATHATPDPRRETFLAERGWQVLHFWNNEVLANRPGILTRIAEVLAERLDRTK